MKAVRKAVTELFC